MKVKFKYNRRYSMIITLSACAVSLWLMINNFHFPAEEVLRIAAVCFALIVPLLLIAAVIGYVLRKISDKKIAAILEQNKKDMSAAEVHPESSQSSVLLHAEPDNKNPEMDSAAKTSATIKNNEEKTHS